MGSAGGGASSNLARIRVAENLSAVLEQRGLSHRAFARATDRSRRFLQAVLAAAANLRIDYLDELAVELHLPVWRLLAPPPPTYYMQPPDTRSSGRALLSARIMHESSRNGWTIGETARRCGCSPGWMYRIVEREVSTGIDLLPALARVFRIALHELLRSVTHA